MLRAVLRRHRRGNNPLENGHRRRRFCPLIYYQGRVKPKETLIDILWPELEPEKSANLFRVTCTYLRTALAERGFPDLLIRELDGYKINTDLINCDLFISGSLPARSHRKD
jgi:two-component SAPR family response regulator